MGEIWLARMAGAAGWSKPVVLKRVLPHLEDDPEFLTRFIDEARIAASLNHGNIVPVFDLGESDGMYFIAMEWIDGWDLRRLLRILEEPLPTRFALYVAREVANGLAYAHERTGEAGAALSIVHRDVSPSNILIARTGEVKVTDFGIASARERLGKTVTGQLRGKFAYMSPEQATGAPVDARSDVFALGALLFEMLTSTKPFDGGSDMATLENVRTGERPELLALLPAAEPELVSLVDGALEVDPDERCESAAEFARSIDRMLQAEIDPVSARSFREFLDERIQSDPVIAVQAQLGGASLDDILNAQLDSGGTPTPSITDSSRVFLASSSGGGTPALARTASASGSMGGARPKTLTQAVIPRRRRRKPWIPITIVLALGVIVGMAALTPGRTTLRVDTTPRGAAVYVDGVLAGLSNIEIETHPGPHTVRLQLDGHDPLEVEVDAEAGTETAIDHSLHASDLAIVFASVPDGARVTVEDDTIIAGNTLRVRAGAELEIHMELEGHEPFVTTHTFAAGDTILTGHLTPIPTNTEPTPSGAGERRAERDPPRERPTRADQGEPTEDTEERPPVEAAGTGRVVVRFPGDPSVGSIEIDGESLGMNANPAEVFELPAGEHVLVVTHPRAGRFERAFALRADEERTINVLWRGE